MDQNEEGIDDSIDVGRLEEQDANQSIADYVLDTETASGDADICPDDMSVDEIEIAVQNDLNTLADDHYGMAIVGYTSYGAGDDPTGKKSITRTIVVKASRIASILGPRTANRIKRNERAIDGTYGTRKDLVAESIRMANYCIADHNINIRDGTVSFPEFELAQNTSVEQRKRGWARRRPHGQQYGTPFMSEKYDKKIREYYARGEEDSSRKMQPGAMLDQLRIDFPGLYSLPGENEIRVLVSTLQAEKKTAEARRKKEEAEKTKRIKAALSRGEDVASIIAEPSHQRKKSVRFPITYVQDLQDAINDAINDATNEKNKVDHQVVYRKLHTKYTEDGVLPEDFPTEDQVKTKLYGLKATQKKQQKRAKM